MSINYDNIPEHMKIAITEYVENGRPMGHFLTAVFSNDLVASLNRADDESMDLLRTYVSYALWKTPADCFGSLDKVRDWIYKFREKSNAGEG